MAGGAQHARRLRAARQGLTGARAAGTDPAGTRSLAVNSGSLRRSVPKDPPVAEWHKRRCGGGYLLPRREPWVEGFAAEAVLDLFLAVGFRVACFAAPCFSAVPACAVGRAGPCDTARSGVAVARSTHFAQRPSCLALSSRATSIGPARAWPQDVVVVALLVRRCHSPDAPAALKSGRIQSDTAGPFYRGARS